MIAKATSQLPTSKREKIKSKIPSFPKRPEVAVIGQKNLNKRKRALQSYLRSILNNSELRNDRNVLEFTEISILSFLNDCGQKNKYAIILSISLSLIGTTREGLQGRICRFI